MKPPDLTFYYSNSFTVLTAKTLSLKNKELHENSRSATAEKVHHLYRQIIQDLHGNSADLELSGGEGDGLSLLLQILNYLAVKVMEFLCCCRS